MIDHYRFLWNTSAAVTLCRYESETVSEGTTYPVPATALLIYSSFTLPYKMTYTTVQTFEAHLVSWYWA